MCGRKCRVLRRGFVLFDGRRAVTGRKQHIADFAVNHTAQDTCPFAINFQLCKRVLVPLLLCKNIAQKIMGAGSQRVAVVLVNHCLQRCKRICKIGSQIERLAELKLCLTRERGVAAFLRRRAK